MSYRSRGAKRRRAAAAVETAIVLPILVFLAVVAFDYCRVFQYEEILSSCARAGAVYGADPTSSVQPAYSDYQHAALAEWPYAANLLTVTRTATTSDDGHNCYDVTASYTFNTVVSYLGVPATVNLSRTVRVRVTQPYPNGVSGL